MKHRITYLLAPSSTSTFGPRQSLKVFKNSIRVSDLPAAKEHRLTLGLSELPQELVHLLQGVKSLHVRWEAERPFQRVVPIVSRGSVGFSVFVELAEEDAKEEKLDAMCKGLKDVFGADGKCDGAEAFLMTPGSSAASKAAHLRQWHSLMPSLQGLSNFIKTSICQASKGQCAQAAQSLTTANLFDLDYDNELDTVTINAYWDSASQSKGWSEIIEYKGEAHERVEVGVLNQEKSSEEGEIKMGGWLTVVGQDVKPKTTLFSFPSRHHSYRSIFNAYLRDPTGLHPMLDLALPISEFGRPTTNATCTLNAYLTLPSFLFIDRYAFTDELFLKHNRLTALRSLSGATDLEAPDWAVKPWGSAALFELEDPGWEEPPEDLQIFLMSYTEVSIPLHLRYMPPAAGGYTTASIPFPVLFYACKPPQDADFKPEGNPFDRKYLGYDELFEDGTIFYPVTPRLVGGQDKLTLDLKVPVLDMDHASYVEPVTAGVVVLAVLWVLWKLFGPMKMDNKREEAGEAKKAQ